MQSRRTVFILLRLASAFLSNSIYFASLSDNIYLSSFLTNLRDEFAELVKVCLVVGVDAELANGLCKLFCAFKRVHLVRLVFNVLEEANVFEQSRFDVVIKEKLRKREEPLCEELERKVDRRVHDAFGVICSKMGKKRRGT